MGKKRGYIYTLDVVIGAIILIIGLFLALGIYFYAPHKVKTDTIASDITGLLSSVQVKDVCAGCDCRYSSLESACPYLTNPDMSIIELFGLLYHKNERGMIEDIMQEMVVDTRALPPNYEMQMTLEDGSRQEQLYPLIP
jgi:hypothetical protein